MSLSTELIFTYETQSGVEEFVQRFEIVKPLPNVTVTNGTNFTEVTVTAVHAGKVTIGLNKTSPEFDEYVLYFIFKFITHCAPFRLWGCENRPAPLPGWM